MTTNNKVKEELKKLLGHHEYCDTGDFDCKCIKIQKLFDQAEQKGREEDIELIEKTENPFRKLRTQAKKQYHAAESMKHMILAELKNKS